MTSPAMSLPVHHNVLNWLKLAFFANPPEVVLTQKKATNSDHPQGFCFKDNAGNFTIELEKPVYISSLVVEHAVEDIGSAPKRFKVIGYPEERWGRAKAASFLMLLYTIR